MASYLIVGVGVPYFIDGSSRGGSYSSGASLGSLGLGDNGGLVSGGTTSG